ncbi:hypothetical protein BASA61_001053 [Batrachochytrium salamandrivorans]|nr:hypothetical protein BASA61_001053 [Batrachochytrium salamandrivorans]
MSSWLEAATSYSGETSTFKQRSPLTRVHDECVGVWSSCIFFDCLRANKEHHGLWHEARGCLDAALVEAVLSLPIARGRRSPLPGPSATPIEKVSPP